MRKQIEQAITTLEIAEMMEVPHYTILEKLEGTKRPDGTVKQIGIIPVLTAQKILVSDYFKLDTYKDASGKENRCYKVTRLGCDFLANKFTGEKGTIFTARYVKRFHDMEDVIKEGIPQKENSNPERLSSVNMMVKNVKEALKEAGVDSKYIAAEVVRIYSDSGHQVKVPLISDVPALWDCTSIARELGIMSESGRPHDKAVSAIIQKLDIFSEEVVRTAYSRNGHDGVTVQYKGSVLEKVREWLDENCYPTIIEVSLSNGKVNKCKVVYREVA